MFQEQKDKKITATSFSNINLEGNSLFKSVIFFTGVPVKSIPYSVLEELSGNEIPATKYPRHHKTRSVF